MMDDWKAPQELSYFLEEGNLIKAINLLESQMEQTPHPMGWYNLGILKKRQGSLLKSLECFEKACSLAPDKAEIWNEIGLIYDEHGQLNKAEGCYEKAVNLDPRFSKAWNNWGVCAFLKRDYQRAKELFEKAITFDAHSFSSWLNLRDTCQELNDKQGFEYACRNLCLLGNNEK